MERSIDYAALEVLLNKVEKIFRSSKAVQDLNALVHTARIFNMKESNRKLFWSYDVMEVGRPAIPKMEFELALEEFFEWDYRQSYTIKGVGTQKVWYFWYLHEYLKSGTFKATSAVFENLNNMLEAEEKFPTVCTTILAQLLEWAQVCGDTVPYLVAYISNWALTNKQRILRLRENYGNATKGCMHDVMYVENHWMYSEFKDGKSIMQVVRK